MPGYKYIGADYGARTDDTVFTVRCNFCENGSVVLLRDELPEVNSLTLVMCDECKTRLKELLRQPIEPTTRSA